MTAAHTVAQLKQLIQYWDVISLKTQVCLHNCTKTGSHENIKITFQLNSVQFYLPNRNKNNIFSIFTFSNHDYHVEFLKNKKKAKKNRKWNMIVSL